MTAYFIRRFLLVVPTFLGITLVVFVITHFVPGGPVERQINRLRSGVMGEAGTAMAGPRGDIALPEAAIEEIRKYYGFDKPVYTRYAQWLWKVLHFDLG